MSFWTGLGSWKASLRTHLVVLILIATVPIAALMSHQILGDIKQQQRRLTDDLTLSAAAIAQGMEREIETTIDTLTILAHADPLKQGDIDAFERYFAEIDFA